MGRVKELPSALELDGYESGSGGHGISHRLCSYPKRLSKKGTRRCVRLLLSLPLLDQVRDRAHRPRTKLQDFLLLL